MSLPPFLFFGSRLALSEVLTACEQIAEDCNPGIEDTRRASLLRITSTIQTTPEFERGQRSPIVVVIDYDDLHALRFILTLLRAELAIKEKPKLGQYYKQWLIEAEGAVLKQERESIIEHLGRIA